MALSACEDYSKHTVGPFNTGSIDVSKYISVGNSLAAGFQNNALYASAEMYSFPNLLARQMGVKDFKQPMISPGIGDQIAIQQFTTDPQNPLVVTQQHLVGQPTVTGPYQNLGIPGAILADYLNADAQSQSGGIKARAAAGNPFYGIVLGSAEMSKQVPSIQHVVREQNPSFVTFWLGNNDALGYVTSGGVTPMNNIPTFSYLFNASIDSILSINGNVKIIAGDIPDVADIPFATTVGPMFRAQLQQAGVNGIYYLKKQQSGPDQPAALPAANIGNPTEALILLTAQNYLPLIGHPTGKYWRDIAAKNNVPVSAVIPSNVDTTYPFMVTPQNPLPNSLILDSDEIANAQTTIDGFNGAIKTVVGSSDRVALLDINSIFNNIVKAGGIKEDGITLTPTIGSLFSFDGVHPTNRGYAIITNEIIKVLNNTYGANIQRINIESIPEGLPLAPGAN